MDATLRRPRRLSDRQRRVLDVVLATALLLPVGLFPVAGLGPASILLATAQLVPLYWRRSHPVAVFAVVAGASAAQVVVIDSPLWSQLAFPVAVYSVARFADVGAGRVALGVGLGAAAVAALDWTLAYEPFSRANLTSYFLTIALIVVAAWALGTLGRTRQAFVDALIERGDRIEREAAQQVQLAAAAERARIAREMHDVVAHGLTTIVVRADGARYAAGRRPEVAVETLEAISETGRASLTDMRRLLGVLRDSGDADAVTTPQPRLPDLAELVDVGGVTADLSGLDEPVTDGVALTSFRVVQEALSNVRKHAGPQARASVRVAVSPTAVEVLVEDDGHGAAAEHDGRGLGLMGMRERVESHAGGLVAGPRPGGGFRVQARIPR